MTAPDAYDRHMIAHAAARGPVIVRGEKRHTLATLVAWYVDRRAGQARIEFRDGRRCTVRKSAVMLPEVGE